jgi:hypothetical protein
VSWESEEPVVVLCALNRNADSVKAGDKVGTVSTVVELAPDSIDGRIPWNIEDLRSQVKIGSRVSSDQRETVLGMLMESEVVLGKDDTDIGLASVTPHVIELTNNTPIWQRPRTFSEPINKEIDRQCGELMSLDIIEYSDSQWSSPVVPVRKKDGSLRMCVDYRALNKVTRTEKFPMPNINESIYRGHRINYFTKLDLVKGYYQVPIDEKSRKFTAFSTPHNHYQFKRLSFGLKNSAIAFQKSLQQILSEFCFNNVIVYIDDILILTETFEEHLDLVSKVLKTLRRYDITIKVEKCNFFEEEVSFLGHVIGREGIKKSPEFIDKITNYPKPTNATELRQFLGLVNFLRKFVDKCSIISKPLTQMTNGPKKKPLHWTAEMSSAFDALKAALLEDVTLSYPNYSASAEKLELFVDASCVGAGGCLVQKQGGQYRTIGYSSMTFTPAQSRYSTIERELVAIRWGVQAFRSFLFGISFILFTDHKPLIYLNNMARDNSRLMRTLIELSEFDFVIKYRPGSENEAADTMSRIVNVLPETNDGHSSVVELPRGMEVIHPAPGGGDSLVVSLHHNLLELDEKLSRAVPSSPLELRVELVDYLDKNPKKFNVKPSKEFRARMKILRRAGQVPCETLLLVAAFMFNIEIHVHHGINWPVIYKVESNDSCPIVHLQCISGVHFNPIFVKKVNCDYIITEKNCNYVLHEDDVIASAVGCSCATEPNSDIFSRDCAHVALPVSACIVEVFSVRLCALVDTGAQVSLLTDEAYNLLLQKSACIDFRPLTDQAVNGIEGTATELLGYVNLQLSWCGSQCRETLPFAVVKASDLPCCMILGANFIVRNKLVLDFQMKTIDLLDTNMLCIPMNVLSDSCEVNTGYRYVLSFCSDAGNESCSSSDESGDNDEVRKGRCLISRDELVHVQNSDRVVSTLKSYVVERVPVSDWCDGDVRQFKRSSRKLRVQCDLLVIDNADDFVPVIPFSLLVDITFKVHRKLAHIGKHKMMSVLSKQFFHPDMYKVVADICSSCNHCQLYKVSSQLKLPPTIKIKAHYPFDLVAMDLLQFQRSSAGHVAVLVAVDHFSKFLMAIPLKDKKSVSVCRALNEQILPHFIRLPARILTDNGPEFKSQEFNDTLANYNITHVYSTPYRACGNGAVERTNRTITEFLKGIVAENNQSWHVALSKAIIVYNSTWHSQIKDSPSNFILHSSHPSNVSIPIDAGTVDTWKEAHPSFRSFTVGMKVAIKINRIGNQLKDKLGKKFKGPYTIVKVQENGVTYEVVDDEGLVQKVHHRQIKEWVDPPLYLQRSMREMAEREVVNEPDLSSSGSDGVSGAVAFESVLYASSCSGGDGSVKDDISCDSFIISVDEHASVGCELVQPSVVDGCIFSDEFKSELYDLQAKFYLFETLNSICPNDEVCDPPELVGTGDSLDWSFGDNGEDLSDDADAIVDNAIGRMSTPVELDKCDQLQIPQSLSTITQSPESQNVSQQSDSLSSFILWLEQSLSVQEEIVDRVLTVSNSLNDGWLTEVSDIVAMSNVHDDDRGNVLKTMSDHLRYVNEGIRNFKTKNKQWCHRFEPSGVMAGEDHATEASDIVPDLRVISQRRTRSQGPVEEYPNVQSKPLEYQLRKRSLYE